jgi:rhodanese-related sulfurtransferase
MSPSFRAVARRFLLLAAVVLLPAAAVAQSVPAELGAVEAQSRTAAGKLTLIDIRTPEEWRETGVATGAVRLDMNHPGGPEGFAKAVLAQVGGNRNAPIALICRSGNRSGKVQRYLAAQGFTAVQSVAEGMAGSAAGPGWIPRGLPVTACKAC